MRATEKVRTVSASEAVIDRIADVEGVDATELTPLYDVIDPDALDALVERSDSSGSPLTVDFSYHGYDVTVTGSGVVDVDHPTPVRPSDD